MVVLQWLALYLIFTVAIQLAVAALFPPERSASILIYSQTLS
jgi:hypothetical protein